MLFNSYAFLFVFFPLTVAGYFLLGRYNHLLSAAFVGLMSLVFYGYWNVNYVPLLLASITFNYATGLAITDRLRKGSYRYAKLVATIGIGADLGLLGYYKYQNFFVENWYALQGIDSSVQTIVLPLGISFYTFTQIAYLVDNLKGKACERNAVHYLLFVTYFPHLIAGPILHHKEMMPQFADKARYIPQLENFACGLTIFFIGLFKKTVLADNLAPYVAPVFAAAEAGESLTAFEAWGGALSYTFQLYFDFSGYCDMAIGLSWILGIHLPLNFNSPYKAADISDFWRRWHMTLSRFLRDYLYIPLGGNRKGEVRRYINLMITMLLGGFWHGAGWPFIIWGLLHGCYLVVHQVWQQFLSRTLGFHLPRSLGIILTFICVVFAWVFFRAPSISGALEVCKAMLLDNGLVLPEKARPYLGALSEAAWSSIGVTFGSTGQYFQSPQQIIWIAAGLAICWGLPNSQQILCHWTQGTLMSTAPGKNHLLRWQPSRRWGVLAGLLGVAGLISMDRVSEFLYFQF